MRTNQFSRYRNTAPSTAMTSSRGTYKLAVILMVAISSSPSSLSTRWWPTSTITATAFTLPPTSIIKSTKKSVANSVYTRHSDYDLKPKSNNHAKITAAIRPSTSFHRNLHYRKLSSLSFWKNLPHNIKSSSVLPFKSSSLPSLLSRRWSSRKANATNGKRIIATTTETAAALPLLKRLIYIYRRFLVPIMLTILGIGSTLHMATKPAFAMAVGGGAAGVARKPMKREEIIASSCLFITLFTALALLHAVEIAITTLYPWKVREFAEEEEKTTNGGIFKILNEDITRVLTTILVTSTAASIYATTIFTRLASSIFGARGETWGAVALTAVTLFFVELLPKSIGVTNAESVARLMVPPINLISTVVSPLGMSLSWLSKQVLILLGLNKGKNQNGQDVSDSELRLIVMGARDSGTIDHSEGEMIKGVLNLQSQRVKEIMRPRVDMVAVPKDLSVASVLGVVRESGYSRIPVYDGEIDNIVGIILAKSVLDFFVKGVLVDDGDDPLSVGNNINSNKGKEDSVVSYPLRSASGEASQGYVKGLTGAELAYRMERTITDANLIEECYFVPDTANGWAVLEEMRKRRIHMAIIVDEYGGTEGLVSLEDIVEEVVGEIYDEDDEGNFEFTEDSIKLQEDGTFVARGDADLEDCDLILGLSLDEEETLKEFGTLSGFLCMCAGEIPKVGDFILSRGWSFEIVDADPKKILTVRVERLVGCFDDEEEDHKKKNENKDKAVLGFLKKGDRNNEDIEGVQDMNFDVGMNIEGRARGNLAAFNSELEHRFVDEVSDGNVMDGKNIHVAAEHVISYNSEEAIRIEKLVDDSKQKKEMAQDIIASLDQLKDK